MYKVEEFFWISGTTSRIWNFFLVFDRPILEEGYRLFNITSDS